ncbi:putative krueppel c2h2-type zinc finger protein [Danaus plexippus plexippus]|uniref:Krueppel c2h2-type zinc finger protein n=1 Tax=Danaus plexippus plexippus TaxID=278856 RepID=A0A212FE85_DANPL|nr:putative krueppel c2h2-type zinc finger protein [Danaus plexippus plexippus]
MPLICNGDNEELLEIDDSAVEFQRKKRSLSTEETFRGFEKVPLVLCQRIDITPYINKHQHPKAPDLKDNMRQVENSNKCDMSKIFTDCSVVLVREDLSRLKEMLSQQNENIKCRICDKGYPSERKLNNHLENKHMTVKTPKRVSFSEHIIVHEVEEYHRCRKCPKIFKDYNTLKVHMRQNHKKRKCYICHYCNKDFVDRTFFKVHIKLHCDACGLLLPNKKLYLEHREKVCRVVKKYECKTCVKHFFRFMDLKDHSYEHLGTFFICDVCKQLFHNKCEVAHHIMYSHSKERPTSSYTEASGSFTCFFCNTSFNTLEGIEKHVGELPDLQNTATTYYNDYHFCDQCSRKFDVESDMLQHKWSHFLKSTDNSQTQEDNDLITDNSTRLKTTYKLGEEIPVSLQPKLVLERIELPKRAKMKKLPSRPESFIGVTNASIGTLKKPIIDPVTKKTILSKHKCEKCGKYLSSNYCLTRHMREVHGIGKVTYDEDLQCYLCEEVFFWPSLLHNHRCIRSKIPEMPFDDARPEIHFDNYEESLHNDNEDFMNMDYEMASPIVQLTEYENLNIVVNNGNGRLDVIDNEKNQMNRLGFKVVMQEVPIEF